MRVHALLVLVVVIAIAIVMSAVMTSCFLQRSDVEACATDENCRAGFVCVAGVCAFDVVVDAGPVDTGHEGEGPDPIGTPRADGGVDSGEGEGAVGGEGEGAVGGEGEGAVSEGEGVVAEGEGVLGEGEGEGAVGEGEGEGGVGEGEGAVGEGEGEGEGTPGECVEECAQNSDCFEGGAFAGFVCRSGRCEFPACTGQQFCTVIESGGGASPCAHDSDCGNNGACVRLQGTGQQIGRCLLKPQNGFCPSGHVLNVHRLHNGFVNVCGATGSCDQATGACTPTCNTNTDCTGGKHCSSGTCVECVADADCQNGSTTAGPACTDHVCGCSADAECTEPGFTTCSTFTHKCGCATDDDCADDTGGHCFDGVCGCFATNECTARVFDATNEQCVALP